MARNLEALPIRMTPHILMGALSEPVTIARGVFAVRVDDGTTGTLEGDLQFRWSPSTAVEIAGTYDGPEIHPETDSVHVAIDTLCVEVPALVASMQIGHAPSALRLILPTATASVRAVPIQRVRFHLVNFPEYIGAPIRYESGKSSGFSKGRLEFESHGLQCVVDEIPEVRELRRSAHRDAGYIISHTAELRGLDRHRDARNVNDWLDMLHLFFGLIRGAWAGPVFPQGFHEEEKIWDQVAAWTVDETREVPTWLPQRSPIQFGDLFDGFIQKWCDQAWNGVLKTAIGWYVASNSSRAPNETRIVMALIALELLAWVELVETRNLCSRSDFKGLSAAERLRCLFHHLNIPLDVPGHFTEVQSLREGDACDVPGIIARLRNALVHATENSRDLINSLSGAQLWEAGQLAVQSIELCLLALCGYRGRYARRAWRGWKGEDEAIVPWA